MNNKITVLFAATFLFGCLQKKNNIGNVAASVNDVFFTETMLKKAVATNPDIRANEHINAWINNELLYQAAVGMDVPLDIKLKSTINKISRSLTIKTYIDLLCSGSLKITNQEIKEYYNKNKEQFFRYKLAAKINHFIISDKKEATKIKSVLAKHKNGKKRDDLIINNRVFSGVVTEGALNNALDKLIFSKRKKKNIIGPLYLKNKFHLIEILETFPRGSPLGLDLVHDEIYQRLINKKLASKKDEVLDSLRNEAEIVVNNKTLK
jgi:hypothetical protein